MFKLNRTRHLLIILLLLIAPVAVFSSSATADTRITVGVAAGKTVTVTDRDNNRAVNLNVGDTLVVRLVSNASTGYTWSIGQNNARLLATVGAPKYVNSTSGLMGAQGTQIFTFRAVAAGGDGLALLYQKPSLAGVQAANTFRLRVVINAVPKPTHTPTRIPTRAPTRVPTRTPTRASANTPVNTPVSTPTSAATSVTTNTAPITSTTGSTKTINLIDEDNNGTVTAMVGDLLVVTLDANQTTGFSWEIIDNVPAILQPITETYQTTPPQEEAEATEESTPEPPRVGVGGTQQFIFEVVAPGEVALKLVYQRPQGTEVGQTWQMLVEVPNNGSSTNATPPVTYACGENLSVEVVFDMQTATVTLGDQTRTLTQRPTGDGFEYADETWALRGVGNTATLTDLVSSQALAADCVSP